MTRTRIPESGSYDDFKKAVMELPYTLANEHVVDEVGEISCGGIDLDWIPVRVGTLSGVVGPYCMHDDMDGRLALYLADYNRAACRLFIDYSKGVITGFPSGMEDMHYNLTYYFDSDIAACCLFLNGRAGT